MKKYILIKFLFLLSIISYSTGSSLNLFLKESKNKFGYVDSKGNIKIPFEYNFSFTEIFETIAFVTTENGTIKAIDKSNRQLFTVLNYDNGPDYESEGLFRIVDDKTNYMGFADMQGNIVIKPTYFFVTPFKNGIAVFNVGGEKTTTSPAKIDNYTIITGGKWGAIDKENKIIFPPIYNEASDIVDNIDYNIKSNEKSSLSHIQENWEYLDGYSFVNGSFQSKVGSNESHIYTHKFFLSDFEEFQRTIIKPKVSYNIKSPDYHSDRYLLTTNIPSPYNYKERVTLTVCKLKFTKIRDHKFHEELEKIKQKNYVTIAPITKGSPTVAYLFWINDEFIIVYCALSDVKRIYSKIENTTPQSLDNGKEIVKLVSDSLIKHKDNKSLYVSDARVLSLAEALKLYGETVEGYLGKDVVFLLEESLPEFRVGLLNIYSKEERLNNKIYIKEMTWKINQKENLTIWYEKSENEYIPKFSLIWDRDLEF